MMEANNSKFMSEEFQRETIELSRKRNMKVYILFVLMMLLTAYCMAQDFHVDQNGSDSQDGSASYPWQSIQHAMDNATPGSTVYIHEGTYLESLYVNVSGSEDQYITFTPFGNDEVIVDGGNSSSYALLEIYNVHHIAIQNIIIQNHRQLDAVGILIEGTCDHIRIKDCTIRNIDFSTDPNAEVSEFTNAQPIAVYGTESDHAITELELLENEIYDCQLGYSEALVVNGNVDGFIIAENYIHDVSNIGIDIIGHEGTCSDPSQDQARNGIIADNETSYCLSPYATSAGIYVDGGKDLIIERNRVHHNQWGIEVGCENFGKSASGIIVRNNFIYKNASAGIAIGGYAYPYVSGSVTDVIVTCNTTYANDTENDYTGEVYLSYIENLSMFNNIFNATNQHGYLLSEQDNLFESINLDLSNNNWFTDLGQGMEQFYFHYTDYDGLDAFSNGSGVANNSLNHNPLFVAYGDTPDLHLNPNSPLINAGMNLNPIAMGEFDIDGEIRIYEAIVDLGADEFGSAVSVEEVNTAKFKVYPNPAINWIQVEADFGIRSIEIIDINGRQVHQEQFTNGRLDVGFLGTGVYLIRLESNSKDFASLRFVKE